MIVHNNDTNNLLPLNIVLSDDGLYYGTFTTTSFSNFAVANKKALSTSGNSGRSGRSKHSSSVSSAETVASSTFVSDTTNDFSVNGTYQFKITSTNSAAPVLVAGTPGVFDVQLVNSAGNNYFIKLIAIGSPGEESGIYVNGLKLLVATVGATAVTSDIKSDTTGSFQVKAGKTYTFKITANLKPVFMAGTPSAFKVQFVKAIGKDYFYQVTAAGKIGTGSGFYVNSKRVAAATITK